MNARLLVLLAASLCQSLEAGPPPDFLRALPGRQMGRAESRWIAPGVYATTVASEFTSETTVRWFDELGAEVRKVSGDRVHANGEFVSDIGDTGQIIYGMSGTWQMTLPSDKKLTGGYVCAEGDTFIHQFHPEEGQISLDIYREGKLAGTAGPFVEFKRNRAQFGSGGALGMLVWKTPEKKAVDVVVIGSDGKIRFRADGTWDATAPYPVGDGRGVLLGIERARVPPVRFNYLTATGKSVPIVTGANGRPIAWIPGGDSVLFYTSPPEETERFLLIDCARGQVLWDIESPVKRFGLEFGNGLTGSAKATVVGDMIVFAGHSFAAVDLKEGKVIARFAPPMQSRVNWGRFLHRGKKTYYVTDTNYSEIDPADITARLNGWK